MGLDLCYGYGKKDYKVRYFYFLGNKGRDGQPQDQPFSLGHPV